MKLNLEFLSEIRKYEIFIASAFILLMIIILSIGLLVPNFNRAQEIYQKQKELTIRLENLRKKDNTLSGLDFNYYKDNFVKINYVLPEAKDYVSLFKTFDLLEKKEGVSIIKTDFQLGIVSTDSSKLAKTAGSPTFFIPVTIEVIGNLPSLQNFIKSLSDYTGRFISIDSFSWVKKDGDRLLLNLSGRAYFYPLPTTLGTVDSPLAKISENEEKILAKISSISVVEEEVTIDKGDLGKKDLFQ